MATVEEFTWIFSAEIDQLEAASDKAAAKLDEIGASASGAGISVANGMGTAATAMLAAGAAALTFSQQVADLTNDLLDMSVRTGIAVDTLNGLALASRGSGQDLKDLEGVLRKVTAEGLNIEDVVAQLQAIEDPTERAAKAMELLGEEGGRLSQAIGDTPLDAYVGFAREFGADVGPRAAKATGDWQREIAVFSTVIEGFMSDVGIPMIEALTPFVENFTRGIVFLGALVPGAFKAMGDGARAFFENLQMLGEIAIAWAEGDWREAMRLMQEGPQDMAGALTDGLGTALDDARARVDEFNLAAWDMQAAAEAAAGAVDDLGAATDSGSGKAEEFGKTLTAAEAASLGLYDQSQETARAAGFVGEEFKESGEEVEEAKNSFEDYTSLMAGASNLLRAVGDLALAVGKRAEEGSRAAEKAAKVAFAVNKAAAIGDIIVKTAQSIMSALVIPPPVGPILAGINAATGAAQLAAVIATPFGGGGKAPSVGGGGGGAGAAQQAAGSQGFGKAADVDLPRYRGSGERGPGGRSSHSRQPVIRYGHRLFDVIAEDSPPGGAFDDGGESSQRRYR